MWLHSIRCSLATNLSAICLLSYLWWFFACLAAPCCGWRHVCGSLQPRSHPTGIQHQEEEQQDWFAIHLLRRNLPPCDILHQAWIPGCSANEAQCWRRCHPLNQFQGPQAESLLRSVSPPGLRFPCFGEYVYIIQESYCHGRRLVFRCNRWEKMSPFSVDNLEEICLPFFFVIALLWSYLVLLHVKGYWTNTFVEHGLLGPLEQVMLLTKSGLISCTPWHFIYRLPYRADWRSIICWVLIICLTSRLPGHLADKRAKHTDGWEKLVLINTKSSLVHHKYDIK